MGFTHPDYTIIRELGHGASGVVYLAVQNQLNRRVAVKVFNDPFARHGADRRFLREARILAQLDHPHIVPVYELSPLPDQQGYLLAMAHVEGGTLSQRASAFSLRQALTVVRQIADALGYAHESGFIHRDVKPDNILFQNDQALLADFGIARAAESQTRMTQHGTMLGTPDYMSPEQVNGDPVDARSDIYSLGIVFYELLTGRPPFNTDSAIATGIQHLTAEVAPLPSAFMSYQELMDKALAKNKDDRHVNAREFISELEEATSKMRLPIDEPLSELRSLIASDPSPQASVTQRRFAFPAAARAFVVLAVLSVVAIWMLRSKSTDTERSSTPSVAIRSLPADADSASSQSVPAVNIENTEGGNEVLSVQSGGGLEQQRETQPIDAVKISNENGDPAEDASISSASNNLAVQATTEQGVADTEDIATSNNGASEGPDAMTAQLARADSLWKEGNWFGGEQSAVAEYRALLALDPGRQDAIDALQDIFTKTFADADKAVSDGRMRDALGSLRHLQQHWPNDDRTNSLELKIQAAVQREQDLERKRSAERQKAKRLNALIDRAQASERDGKLFAPERDSAYFYYQQVLSENANNSRAINAIKALKQKMLQRVSESGDDGQFDEAETQLSLLEKRYPADPEVASAVAGFKERKQQFEQKVAEANRRAEEAREIDRRISELNADIDSWLIAPTTIALSEHSVLENRIDQLQLRSPQNATLVVLKRAVARHLETLNAKRVAESAEKLEETFNMPGF